MIRQTTKIVFPRFPKREIGTVTELNTLTNPGGAEGDMLYWDGTNWIRLEAGIAGDVLKTNGIGNPPEWADVPDHTHSIADVVIDENLDLQGFKAVNSTAPVDDDDLTTKAYVDSVAAMTNVYDLQGQLDCSSNPNFPAGVTGMRWEVSVAGKIGGASGLDVEEWDEVVCSADNAGGDYATVGSNWYVVKSRVLQATETYSGTAELATDAETQTGTDNLRIVTPEKLKNWWTWVKTEAQTFADKITLTTAPRFSSVTSGHFLKVDTNKDLTSVEKIQPSEVDTSSSNRFVTDAEKSTYTTSRFGISINGQSAVITTGFVGSFTVEQNQTLISWFLNSNISGNIVIDVKKNGVSMIGAGNSPTLSGTSTNNAIISGWTSNSVVAGDVIEFTVTSANTLTYCTLVVKTIKD